MVGGLSFLHELVIDHKCYDHPYSLYRQHSGKALYTSSSALCFSLSCPEARGKQNGTVLGRKIREKIESKGKLRGLALMPNSYRIVRKFPFIIFMKKSSFFLNFTNKNRDFTLEDIFSTFLALNNNFFVFLCCICQIKFL
jgi:hypothetical protein